MASEVDGTDDLFEQVYDELRRLAHARLRRLPPGQTLQTTALVHEAYVRLASGGDPVWQNRPHFYGAAARAMRNILVDEARRKGAEKRGADCRRLVDSVLSRLPGAASSQDLLDLDYALSRLEAASPAKAEVVSLRFFAGLDMEEIAEVVGRSIRSIHRDWRFARAWLQSELGAEEDRGR